MARDNEQVCLLVFNVFAFVCVGFSCMTIYELQSQYASFDPPKQQACLPYVTWKCGFLFHLIFLFTCLAFTVGTAQTYLEEDLSREARRTRRYQMQLAHPNERLWRLRFNKMVENALDVLRLLCLSFCGPTLLVECLLTLVWYSEIVHGCPITDGFTNVLVYVLLIIGCISLAVTAFCGYSAFVLGKTVRAVWPQIRNPPPAPPESEEEEDEQFREFAGRVSLPGGSTRVSYSETSEYRRLRESQDYEDRLIREMQAFLAALQEEDQAPPPRRQGFTIQDDDEDEDDFNEYERVHRML